MTPITIPAQVVNGHLQHEKSVAELEGQHVLVTLTVMPKDTAGRKESKVSAPQVQPDEFWPQPELVPAAGRKKAVE